MNFRRRPIPKSRAYPDVSQHYDVILNGAVRRYRSDGREVCQENAAGKREYLRRVQIMVQRQSFRCGDCNRRLSLFQATFDHWPIKRKMGAAFRDDRITDEEGSWMNRAVHWECQ
jgi:hypothetical protein